MSEWDRRELCPDGACTGVVGEDDRCTVCDATGTPRDRSVPVLVAATVLAAAAAAAAPVGDGWVERVLCSDGGCTGVIGERGVCIVCGAAPGA